MIQLLAGGVVLAQDNNAIHPASGTFATSTIVYTSGVNDPLAGQNLEIRLIYAGTATQVGFDNVRLTDPYIPVDGVPEPASLLLIATGGSILVFRRRRSIK